MNALNVVIVSQAFVLYQCRAVISMIHDVSEGVYIQWIHSNHISFFLNSIASHGKQWHHSINRCCISYASITSTTVRRKIITTKAPKSTTTTSPSISISHTVLLLPEKFLPSLSRVGVFKKAGFS